MSRPSLSALLILACLTILGLALILAGVRLGRQGVPLMGKPTIPKGWFYLGKLSMVICGLFLVVQATYDKAFHVWHFHHQGLIAFLLTAAGSILMITSFFNLGKALRVGLPEQETQLSTHGMYRFSRNPLYVGVFLVNLASMVYCPILINLFFGVACTIIHHYIILGEEKFLEGRFGTEWNRYKKHTPRYLFI